MVKTRSHVLFLYTHFLFSDWSRLFGLNKFSVSDVRTVIPGARAWFTFYKLHDVPHPSKTPICRGKWLFSKDCRPPFSLRFCFSLATLPQLFVLSRNLKHFSSCSLILCFNRFHYYRFFFVFIYLFVLCVHNLMHVIAH